MSCLDKPPRWQKIAPRRLRQLTGRRDCQMPVMDGYEATRALRAEPRWRDLPVIAMTANAMVGDREKVLEAGMNDHIAKPIRVDELYATLARWAPGARVAA